MALLSNSSNCARKVHVEKRVDCLCVVDQFDAQDFNKNSAGWTRNDICQLARAQSQAEYDAIMKRLQVIPDSPGEMDGLSRKDAMSRIKSRYCQSALEVEQFAQLFAEDEQRRLNEAYQKVVEKQVVADKSADVLSDASANAPAE